MAQDPNSLQPLPGDEAGIEQPTLEQLLLTERMERLLDQQASAQTPASAAPGGATLPQAPSSPAPSQGGSAERNKSRLLDDL